MYFWPTVQVISQAVLSLTLMLVRGGDCVTEVVSLCCINRCVCVGGVCVWVCVCVDDHRQLVWAESRLVHLVSSSPVSCSTEDNGDDVCLLSSAVYH